MFHYQEYVASQASAFVTFLLLSSTSDIPTQHKERSQHSILFITNGNLKHVLYVKNPQTPWTGLQRGSNLISTLKCPDFN